MYTILKGCIQHIPFQTTYISQSLRINMQHVNFNLFIRTFIENELLLSSYSSYLFKE